MNIPLLTKKNPSCAWPDNLYRTYMNGRLKKTDMEARLLHIKKRMIGSWKQNIISERRKNQKKANKYIELYKI